MSIGTAIGEALAGSTTNSAQLPSSPRPEGRSPRSLSNTNSTRRPSPTVSAAPSWPLETALKAPDYSAPGAAPIVVVGTTRDPSKGYEWRSSSPRSSSPASCRPATATPTQAT